MTSERWLLQVTDLKQYAYCPRVVYYEYCTPGIRPRTYKMDVGNAAQDRVSKLEMRRSLKAYGVSSGERHFHVSLTSDTYGCSAQLDLVIETTDGAKGQPDAALAQEQPRRLIPVDFKLSRRKPESNVKLQLACYALMLEESWGWPADEGYIYLIPTKQSIRIPMTTRLRNDAKRKLSEVREMIEQQRIPPPTKQRGKCVNCEFRRFCNDVL
ncbi:MAG: CRISPR-associated protein Cas4 [Chloroflexota bacterium]